LSECLSIQISRNLYFIFLWAHPLVALRKIHKFREMKNADCAKSQFCFFTFSAAAFCPPLLSLFSFCRWNCCYDIFMKNFKFTIGIGQHTQAFLPPHSFPLSRGNVCGNKANLQFLNLSTWRTLLSDIVKDRGSIKKDRD